MSTASSPFPAQELLADYQRCMIHNLPRYPILMVRGQGARLWDAQGREYLDLFAGFGGSLLGHCHPDLIRAVQQQASQLWFAGNLFYMEPQIRAARAISQHSFGGRCFFCHSGAEANEAAFKLARYYGYCRPGKAGPRYKIISTTQSFHGRTFGTMPATGNEKVRQGFGPLVPGFVQVPYNDLAAVEREIDELTVAIIAEPIQGEGGINVPDPQYFAGLRRLCDQHDLVLIADEVWTGCGRTGQWFGYQHWNVEPDVISLGKGIGGGLAVGAICAKPHLAEYFDAVKQGLVKHATTMGGNCLAMAAAAAVFQVLERDGLVQRAAELGQHVMARLNHFAQACKAIAQVRGRGLFIGIELNPDAPGAWFKNASQVAERCMEQGVLVNATRDVVLRLAPPLIISREELDQGLEVLERAIRG